MLESGDVETTIATTANPPTIGLPGHLGCFSQRSLSPPHHNLHPPLPLVDSFQPCTVPHRCDVKSWSVHRPPRRPRYVVRPSSHGRRHLGSVSNELSEDPTFGPLFPWSEAQDARWKVSSGCCKLPLEAGGVAARALLKGSTEISTPPSS